MSPTPGSRPGLYNVVSPVGAGGMGEAYRTRDLKLNRDAATKVLAAPNHPSIAIIYGIEEFSDRRRHGKGRQIQTGAPAAGEPEPSCRRRNGDTHGQACCCRGRLRPEKEAGA